MTKGNEENRFRTYLQYTCGLSAFLSASTPDALFSEVVASDAFRDMQGGRCQQPDRLSQILRNAWMTEVLTRLATVSPQYASYANLWLPVQAYYSAYLGLRALFLACGRQVPNDHANTLRTIARDIERRPGLFAFPWRTICTGNPNSNQVEYHNLPAGVVIGMASSLANHHNVEFADSYGMLLRTTRKRLVDACCEKWKKDNCRQRIPGSERIRIAANLAPTSLFDFLYRMRLRSNYSDADSFLLTLHLENDAQELSSAIVNIVWHNAFMIELLICRYLGKNAFTRIVDEFRKHDTSGTATRTVCARLDAMKTWW